MKCCSCEKEITSNDGVCPHCGAQIQTKSVAKPSKKAVLWQLDEKMPKWAYILAIIGGVLTCIPMILEVLKLIYTGDIKSEDDGEAVFIILGLTILSLIFFVLSIKYKWACILGLILNALPSINFIITGLGILIFYSDIGNTAQEIFLMLIQSLIGFVGFVLVLIGEIRLIREYHLIKEEREYYGIKKNLKVNAQDLGVEFEDIVVGEKEWKAFKKEATEDELFVFAIGAKVMSSGKKFFIKALVSVLGTLLSVVIGLFAVKGMFGVVVAVGGYLIFNLMAVKLTSYSSTLRDCYKKLGKENKEFVDKFEYDSILVSVLKWLVEIGLLFFTIPYRAILMLISTLLPQTEDWCIAHGGIGGTVITLPKGYDIGGLREVGEYYASQSFIDAWEEHWEADKQNRLSKMEAYIYEDETGVRKAVYSDDKKNFYASTNKTTKIGESADGAKTMDIRKK